MLKIKTVKRKMTAFIFKDTSKNFLNFEFLEVSFIVLFLEWRFYQKNTNINIIIT